MIREEPYPFQSLLGFEIVDWRKDFCRLEQPMRPELGNRYGILHGGVHATLLDTAMGFAASWTGDPDRKQLVMTLSLNVNYVGQTDRPMVAAEGRRIGGGRRTAFTEGTVLDDTGAVVATGTAVFRYRG